MHDETIQSPPTENPARHEPTDINTRPLKIMAAVSVIAAVVIPLGLLWLFRHYEHTATHPDLNMVKFRPEAPGTPEPRIQGVPTFHGNIPRADMEELRRQSQQRLNSYGKSEDQGFVRIPIDRAMQILVDKGMKPTTQKAQ